MCEQSEEKLETSSVQAAVDSRIGEAPRPRVFLWAAVFEGGLVVLALALGWLCDYSPIRTLHWNFNGAWIGLLCTIPPVLGLLVIDRFPIGPLADLNRVVDELIVPLFRGMGWPKLLVIALLAGVGEEMLFRGLLQGGLERVLSGQMDSLTAAIVAILVASAVFGMLHYITRLYAILCFLMGIYLGAIWLLPTPDQRNLLVPIIVHALYDFVALIYWCETIRPRDASPDRTALRPYRQLFRQC